MTKTVEKTETSVPQTHKGSELETPLRRLTPFDEMDRLFEGLFSRRWPRLARWEYPDWGELSMPFEGRMPKVDVVDRDEDILVRVEAPGVEKKDLELSMTDNTLTIKGTTSRKDEEEHGDYFRREIAQGSFTRTLVLPGEVDGSSATTSFKDGVLELRLPKIERSKRHRIEIK